jgi:large subunit ribosomal protein L5
VSDQKADPKEAKKKPAGDSPEKAPKAEKAAKGGGEKGKRKKPGEDIDVKIAGAGETRVSPKATPALLTHYRKNVVPSLIQKHGFKNAMEVPRLKKVVINCCVKEAVANPKVLDNTMTDITLITGQKPVLTRAKKAISVFKLRAGIPIGVRVTLRRARMYEFLYRLMNVALPRVRDFRGVNPKAFDGRGNYSLGLREQIVFPEINYDKVDSVRGLTVTIETSAKTNEHARALLTELGMPFRK